MPIFRAFGAVAWALDNKGAVALFALTDAFAAEIVIGDTVAVIQEKCPFLFSLFTHSRHKFSSFLRGRLNRVFVFFGFIGGRLAVKCCQIVLNGGKLLIAGLLFVVGVIGGVFLCNQPFDFSL